MYTSTLEKNWVQNVVYMSNERNWSVFLRRLFLFRFRLFFVLGFYFFAFVSFVTTNPDQFLSKPSTSVSNQRSSSDPFEIQTLCSFHRVR